MNIITQLHEILTHSKQSSKKLKYFFHCTFKNSKSCCIIQVCVLYANFYRNHICCAVVLCELTQKTAASFVMHRKLWWKFDSESCCIFLDDSDVSAFCSLLTAIVIMIIIIVVPRHKIVVSYVLWH